MRVISDVPLCDVFATCLTKGGSEEESDPFVEFTSSPSGWRRQRDSFVDDYFRQRSSSGTGIITDLALSELDDNMYTTVINIVHMIM